MGRKKSSKRSTVNCLYSCLKLEAYPHILKWTDNEREFSILFRRKGSSNWASSDLDFFKKLDSLSPSKKEKYLNQSDYDLGCKRRCKANLQKLCKDNILKYLGKEVIDKSTKLKYYKFLEIPKEEIQISSKPFLVRKKRESIENIDVVYKREKHNSSNVSQNNNENLMCSEEFGEDCFVNFYGSDNCKLPEIEFSNANSCELPETELSNINEFLQIKVSLPGYFELPENSSIQPLWSYCFTPQIKNGMNIDEVADIL